MYIFVLEESGIALCKRKLKRFVCIFSDGHSDIVLGHYVQICCPAIPSTYVLLGFTQYLYSSIDSPLSFIKKPWKYIDITM